MGGNYISYKSDGMEFFRTHPIGRVSVVGSRLMISLNRHDREAFNSLSNSIRDPIMVDVYVGDAFYCTMRVDFQNITVERSINIPAVTENLGVFEEVGIRVFSAEKQSNYLELRYNDFELFRSLPLRSVSVTESEIIIPFSNREAEILNSISPEFDGPVVIAAFVGEEFYASITMDFQNIDFYRGMVLPKLPERLHLFRDAGIRVK